MTSAGCGGGDDDDDTAEMPMGESCSGGESYSCVTRSGCAGHRFCTSERVLGPCECDSSTSGSGGGGGNGPSGADSGTSDPGAGRGGSSGRGGSDSGEGGSAGKQPEPGKDAGTPRQDAGKPEPGDEQCDNGDDDDGDGDVDCADDDCAQRECLDGAPDGWTGPAVLRVGTNVPNECTAAYAHEVLRGGTGVTAAAATCSACTCSPATGSCASFLSLVSSAQNNCGGSATCSQPFAAACRDVASSCLSGLGTGYIQAQVPQGGSSCTPSAQSPTLPATGWEISALGCDSGDDLVRGGCDSGEVCAPKQPDGTDLCIVREGDVACPNGPYSRKSVYYTDVEDERSCTGCECDQDCAYKWNVYAVSDTMCTMGALAPNLDPGQCVAVSPTGDTVRVGFTATGTGACTASGGQPTGTATATDAVTVCCLP